MVIGKGGANVDALRAALNKLTGKQVHINIIEIKRPDLDAHLVGEGIARQLEQRVAFRRAQKQAIQRAMRAGAKGIKTQVSGRLNGADIARAEGYSEGTVPLHTLRADIDYAWEEADTTYFNTKFTVSSVCFFPSVIDISAKCVEWNSSFRVSFCTGNICTVQTT